MTAVRVETGTDLFLARVESLLAERLADLAAQWRVDSAHEDPVLGPVDLPELLAHLVTAGGKRLRPRFAYAGWVAAGGSGDAHDLTTLGAALELLHAFGLVQDDVMDRSTTRRGAPSVHQQASVLHPAGDTHYGDGVATLVGDLAHVEADALVADLPSGVRRRWRALCVELVRGQTRDLSLSAATGPLAAEDAWQVARDKSGAYTVQRPVELGAALAGVSDERLAVLSRAGRLLGEAFAMRDDLLGAWGDPTLTGKPVGDDLREAKPTVLRALAEQRLTGDDAAALHRLRTHPTTEDAQQVSTAMLAAGLDQEVEAIITARRRDAGTLLAGTDLAPDGVGALLHAADLVVGGGRA